MEILRARLYSLYRSQQESTLSQQRRSQIGTGERSEKIRTYNFPQNRVTDHRINYTTYRLQDILDGDLDELIAKLAEADINIKLEKLLEEMTTA
jgi:peptide chain release factor 1